MPSLRRSLLRRYRLFAPYLFRHGLVLLVLLLLGDGIAAICFPQIQAALSLTTPVSSRYASGTTPAVVAMTTSTSTTVLASDTFQRANQLYWGTSSDGHPWKADASSARNFAIFNHTGWITATVKHVYCDALLGPVTSNVEITFSAALSQYGASSLGAVLRWSSPDNFYELALDGETFALERVVDGMMIPLQSVPLPARAGAIYTFRFRASGTQLSAMVWPDGQPAPDDWQIAISDDALSTGQAGIRVIVQNGAQARITAFTEVQL